MKLSRKTIEATTKAGRYSDGRNLYLNVSSTGAKSWVFMWMSNGRQRELGLGSFTGAGRSFAVTLEKARLAADAVRAQIAAGVDPIAAKLLAKVATVTFHSLMVDLINASTGGKDGWKVVDGDCEQANEWTRSLSTHAAPLLAMQAGRVDTNAVVAVLKPIWKDIPTTAERIRFRIEKVMALAISKGAFVGENPARYDGHIANLVGKRPTKKGQTNHAALAYDDVPAFVQRLLGHKGSAARALAFVTLTATRTDETRLARWSEIDAVKAIWTIPADRMKAGVEHIVPLSTAALALLDGTRVAGNEFLFPGKKEGCALGATALSDKLEEMGHKGTATVHGMRSAFSDWVGDKTGFAKEDREFCLAHGLDAVEGAYRRSTAIEKRRAIMQAWADYATGVSNVIKLAVAA